MTYNEAVYEWIEKPMSLYIKTNPSDLIEYLNTMIEVNMINPSNVILSININDICFDLYDSVLDIIRELKRIGFNIGIDKYNSKTTDYIFENAEIDYIKVSTEYWKESIENEKTFKLLSSKLKVFNEFSQTKIIFGCIEKVEEFKFIKENFYKFLGDDLLVSGNYFSDDNKIKIK